MDTELNVQELEKVARKVAAFVRQTTDQPAIGIAACFAAGIFWSNQTKMPKDMMEQILSVLMSAMWPESQNDLDSPRKDH